MAPIFMSMTARSTVTSSASAGNSRMSTLTSTTSRRSTAWGIGSRMAKKRFFLRISPITWHILAVNVGALLILVVGLLYSGKYENELIRTELNALTTEGRLLSAALAEGGTRPTLAGDPVLAVDLSRQMLRKLSESNTD